MTEKCCLEEMKENRKLCIKHFLNPALFLYTNLYFTVFDDSYAVRENNKELKANK